MADGSSIRLSGGLPFNPLIAIDLSWADAFADLRTETFVRCWNDQIAPYSEELVLRGCRLEPSQLTILAQEIASSPALLEDILGCYFDDLEASGELSSRGVDATAWALGIADHLSSGKALWQTRVEIYRHTWKIKRFYQDTSAISLAPIYQVLDRTTPEWPCVSAIYQHVADLHRLDQISIPEWVIEKGIKSSIANIRFINFLLYNDTRFVSSADVPFKYFRLDSLFENFESASSHFDYKGCVEASGLSLRDGLDPSGAKIALLSHAVIDHFRPAWACHHADHAELTLKAFLRSKECGQLVQGIPLGTYELIMDAIRKLGRIVSLQDVRRVSGASRLRVDPFQLDPGPLVVYAPGDRYLQGDSVSFALREWVQDDVHKRARVAEDRILTPLRPCEVPAAPKIKEHCMTSSHSFKRTGVVFRKDACAQLKPSTDKQGQRWAIERTLRAIDHTLTGSGLIRSGDAFFDKALWDLRDAKRLSSEEVRVRISETLTSGYAPSAALSDAGFRDRVRRATGLATGH